MATAETPALYTLCYPQLSDADRRFIDEYRYAHDIPYRSVVGPHFTMIFGCREVPLAVYREHVAGVARSQRPIAFSCRYAMLHDDDENDNYYVFLVPDEGYGELSLLHDKLYRGPLAPFLRLDIPYVPHIGIATMADASRVKALCDALNAKGVEIHGRIDALTICAYDGSTITDVESFPCGRTFEPPRQP